MRRLLRVAVITVMIGTVAVTAPARAAVPQGAVTWTVDHVKKTITVSVKLLLYPSCIASSTVHGNPCNVSTGIADRVRNDILKVWNNNGEYYHYKCYRLIFEVDVKVDNNANRFTVDKDRVGVQIEKSAVNFRSFVRTTNTASSWDDSSKLPVPDNTTVRGPTTWAYPPGKGFDREGLYAHEFGHVIGLDDAYHDETIDGKTVGVRNAGAPEDLMSGDGTNIHQRTIRLLVQRSGIESTLQCDYKIDTMVEWFHFEALKCGSAEGRWNIVVTGVRDLGRGARLVAEGDGRVDLMPVANASSTVLTGGWSAVYRTDVEGIPLSTGGDEGDTGGDARFDYGVEDLILHLHATHQSGNFWATTPYRSLSGSTLRKLKDLDLPVTNGKFC
jgi:hypothetical protein